MVRVSPSLVAGNLLVSLCVFLPSWVKGDSVMFESSEYATGVLGDAPFQSYFSVDYTPAEWNFVKPQNHLDTRKLETGYIFMAPRGPKITQFGAVIYDQNGEMVWNGNQHGEAMSFSVVQYMGEPHIAMWQGQWTDIGTGIGYNILLNQHYEVVANYTTDLEGDTGKTYADFHEASVTSNNTGLMTAYQPKSMDLSPYGGPSSGWILDSVAQEVNIETGKALWTWKASEKVDPGGCFSPLGDGGTTTDNAWDFFHINSIEKDDDGDFLISSRHCCTIYYLSGADGHIIWSLGGAKSSFEMGQNTSFCFQHDARWIARNQTYAMVSLFDNSGMSGVYTADTSRGLILGLDFTAMKASFIREYIPYDRAVSESQGSVQLQSNGNVIIGWGYFPLLAEYTSDGELLWTAQFGVMPFNVTSYRALRYDWTGLPTTTPSIELVQGSKSSLMSVYASWNGATEIDKWEILGSSSDDGSNTISLFNRSKTGFETTMTLTGNNLERYSFYAVRALDRKNKALGMSDFKPKASLSRISSNGAIGVRISLVLLASQWIILSGMAA